MTSLVLILIKAVFDFITTSKTLLKVLIMACSLIYYILFSFFKTSKNILKVQIIKVWFVTSIIVLLYKYLIILDLRFLRRLRANNVAIFCLIVLSIYL